MTTSNEITLDDINAYLDIFGTTRSLDIAPTATGGAGINNLAKYPPPQPSVPSWRRAGTEYVKKYQDKEKESQYSRRIHNLPAHSIMSLETLDDVEDISTTLGDTGLVSELNDEATQQIYSTYFNIPNRTYDPNLTITSYREEILQHLNINPVIIIQGPTGCGKTTQVPQYILDYHQARGTYCNIVVTQPRKIAAISIARRVCQERSWQLGTIVGYQVAMDPKVSSDTRLSYVTTGVLLEKLVNAKRMTMFTHIIIDEVHERNQDIDFALLLVKKFLLTNSQRVKVILMSATFDSSAFADYFSLSSRGDKAPIIEISGKSKDVTEHYLHELKTLLSKIPEFDMLKPSIDPCLYDCVLKLMCVFDRIEKAEQSVPSESEYAPSRGAVLIFLPGYEEISSLSKKLETASFNKNFWIIPLHSSITVEEQTKVFRNPPHDHRKVILSTNIAESSITVPDVKYVIDFCLTKSLVTDPASNYTCLQLEWASKANCIQRKGRAGRVDIGKVYRMVPEHFYNDLPEYGIPEIKRCPLTSTILHVKKLNLCEPQEMLAFALDPPDLSDIGTAVLQLKEALALTSRDTNAFDGDLTFIGRVMANLPLDIKLSKLIIFGYVFHCLEECIIIAASLSLQSFFAKPFQKELDAYRSRLAWADGTFSDCLTFLNAYNMWKKLSIQGQFRKPGGLTENDWARLNFIQIKRIKEVDMLVKEIKSRLEKLQILVDRNQRYGEPESNILILKMIISGAFFPYYYLQEELDEKKVNREINDNDPHSTVLVTGLPPKHGILYASALKDMFSCCSENMMIEFEETKAYIRFPRNNETISTVLQPVYLAMKMRELRQGLELCTFSQEEADRKLRQIMATRQGRSENQLTSNRITVKYKEHQDIKKIELPPVDGTQIITIFITNFINSGHFWARYQRRDIYNHVVFLEQTINQFKGENLRPLGREPQVNALYLAPYFEGKEGALFYRAQVKEIIRNRVKVFFIDYGNVETIDIGQLREIDASTPDILTTPALAFECHLSEIKPSSIKSPTGDWCDEANIWFKKKVSGAEMHAKIYSVVQDTVRLELQKVDRDGIRFSVNKQLLEMGWAEPAEESLASKQNHELRETARDYRSNAFIPGNTNRDFEVSWKQAIEFDGIAKTGRRVRLRGPYNPLQVSYCGLSNMDRSKSVRMERDSVNSVSFNAEPQDPYTSMLVAAHVGVGQSNLELRVRSTTLMPKLRGLPSLICLLFAPYAEIRSDKAMTSYTGALCGLGFDPQTGVPIYPDHDIEIAFDIKLTLSDITQINRIRMGFNMLLHSDNDVLQYESRTVSIIHQEARKTVLDLLKVQREPSEAEFYRNPCQWNQIKADLLLDPELEQSGDCPHVLPLHKPPHLMLTKGFKKQDSMEKHLEELYKKVEHPTNKFNPIRCKLCSKDLTSTRDLLLHLNDAKHEEKEKLLKFSR